MNNRISFLGEQLLQSVDYSWLTFTREMIFFVPPSQPITVIKGHFTVSGSIHFTLCAWFSRGEIKIKRAEGLQIASDFYNVWNYNRFFFFQSLLNNSSAKNRETWRVWHRSVFSCYDFMLLKRSWCQNIVLKNRFKSFGIFKGLSTLRLECTVIIRHSGS